MAIDPGSVGSEELISWLDQQELTPKYILLTHHHFDHIAGVNALKGRYPDAQVICSRECGELVVDRKKNCSLYRDGVGFELAPPDLVFDKEWELTLDGEPIFLYSAPGHSTSSILIEMERNLFTGDTLIQNTKTVVKLPTASKEALRATIDRLALRYGTGDWTAHAGHGPSFALNDYDFSKAL